MPYTDFADELFARANKQVEAPHGVRIASASKENLTITRVEILRGGLAYPKGRYITIETPNLSILDERDAAVIDTAAEQLRSLLPPKGKILVVGVGNRRVTADAIGPRTAQKVLMTASVAQELPNLRPVYVVAPGVSAATGIPLAQMLESLVDAVRPSAVLCIDSLVSSEPARLGRTIQFSNTGLCPTSAQSEKCITPARLGLPVIAAGIPTLLYAPQPEYKGLVMVPQTLDQTVSHGAALLSAAINRALQPSFSLAQLCWLAH